MLDDAGARALAELEPPAPAMWPEEWDRSPEAEARRRFVRLLEGRPDGA